MSKENETSWRKKYLLLCGCSVAILRSFLHNGSLQGGRRIGDDSELERPKIKPMTTHSLAPLLSQPFPRWGKDDEGLELKILAEFINGVFKNEASTGRVLTKKASHVDNHSLYPETLYVMDKTGLWVSETIRNRNRKVMLGSRAKPTERLFLAAAKQLRLSDSSRDAAQRWPRLHAAITVGQGFPFFIWYGDYRDCNFLNWKGEYSIPLFTTCAPVKCSHAFPIPNYETVMDSQSIVGMWDTIFAQQNERFPWESKLPQVVWRGALSGDINNYQNIRWRLCVLMTKLRASSESIADQFDIGLTRVPDRHNHLSLNLTEAGGLAKPILEKDFQMYRAILDVDGNAWSKRFGQLLCFNSVVLKVEPSFVEYLYKDLIAWKHFVPVKADFSDLVEISAYILDPSNEHVVRSIISDANEWCRASMIQAKLVNDTCDILENYVGILDKADAFWMETWSNASKEIKAPDKGYKMTKL